MSVRSGDPCVSVIIPARDAAPTLERTLASLDAQALDRPFEVIVVDDGSQDDTAAIARRHGPRVRLLSTTESGGPGAARNRGVVAARARVFAFTDADCFPTPKWLANGLEHLANADLVQGRVDPDPNQERAPFDRSLIVDDHGGFYQTANLFVRRDTFEAAGGFRDWVLEQTNGRRWSRDRRRGRAMRTPIGEDTLFAWSARRRGARSTFAPNAVVHHAVVPGTLMDDVADRWHWARDMPGLAQLVPELRAEVFEHRFFFNWVTVRFDLTLAGVALSAFTAQRRWLLLAVPYLRYLLPQATRWRPRSRGAAYLVGATVADAATFAGLLRGSVKWRCLVL